MSKSNNHDSESLLTNQNQMFINKYNDYVFTNMLTFIHHFKFFLSLSLHHTPQFLIRASFLHTYYFLLSLQISMVYIYYLPNQWVHLEKSIISNMSVPGSRSLLFLVRFSFRVIIFLYLFDRCSTTIVAIIERSVKISVQTVVITLSEQIPFLYVTCTHNSLFGS